MTNKQKHTPGPWYIKRTGNEITAGSWEILCQLDDSFVGQLYRINKIPYNEVEANAAFIVTACNNHYELLEACKEALAHFDKYTSGIAIDCKDSLRMAIQKAEATR